MFILVDLVEDNWETIIFPELHQYLTNDNMEL